MSRRPDQPGRDGAPSAGVLLLAVRLTVQALRGGAAGVSSTWGGRLLVAVLLVLGCVDVWCGVVYAQRDLTVLGSVCLALGAAAVLA
jgi:hypothetical protein